jgi:hypothetical protein
VGAVGHAAVLGEIPARLRGQVLLRPLLERRRAGQRHEHALHPVRARSSR